MRWARSFELLVEADEADEVFAAAEAEFERLEQIMSRFRSDSELSRLNATVRSTRHRISPRWSSARSRRVERTGGRFDPTIHDALVGAGYDRTFDELPEDTDAAAMPLGLRRRLTVAGRGSRSNPA